MNKPSRKEDAQHLRTGYALLKEAIDEFAQVHRKDATLANVYRTLGVLEDKVYQMVTDNRRAAV